MGYIISPGKMNHAVRELKKEYLIYAPKRYPNRGWKPGEDSIRYGEIDKIEDVVYNAQSDFSPKEIFYPISQTMLYFKGDECQESQWDPRKIILFARPCDINGIKRLDKIFLENGRTEDFYYKRIRENLTIFMIECREGYDTCFCASMDANKTEEYSVALRFEEEDLLVDVKDSLFEKYFAGAALHDFSPEFILKNKKKVELPVIEGTDVLKAVHEFPMWKEYNDTCLSCGSCSTVCITCSCFSTTDIIYDETSRDGERRRIWTSCMLEDFSAMAGGHNVRASAGDRMRFRTLHKVYDYKSRFGEEHMCVGCGRCDKRCPAEISFSDTINRLSTSIREVMEK